jgi:hypothetical protein
MASEVAHTVASRFVANVPGSPGVIAVGETAVQAQMRAAVVSLWAKVFQADDAKDRPARQWRSAVELMQRLRLKGLFGICKPENPIRQDRETGASSGRESLTKPRP